MPDSFHPPSSAEARPESKRHVDPPAPSSSSLRIVVIEDDPDSATLMAILLRRLGHDARVAFDGTSGIALAMQVDPDVVLCDLRLPGVVDGCAVARTLRPALPGASLVAWTGLTDVTDRRNAEAAGFDLFLRKPVDMYDLAGTLARSPKPRISA